MRTQLRAISPVIATVIIVAVALAIAVAVVGWLMGLWSGLAAGTPQIAITNVKVYVANASAVAEVYVKNSGSGSDTILKAELVYGTQVVPLTLSSATSACVDVANSVVQANCASWITFTGSDPGLKVGDTVVIKIYFEKSGTQTIQGVVSAQ